jgi:diguanylate cyclase (GGDEF)-like protein/PAS domain S-box-containing protein
VLVTTPAGPEQPHEDSWQRYLPAAGEGVEMVYETDLRGVIRTITPSVHDLLGWLPEQLIGTAARDLLHPLDLERIDAMRARVYRDQDTYQQIPCMFRTVSGAYRAATVRSRPLVDATGTVTGALVRAFDTHDRDVALRALATLSEANRTLVRASDEADLLQQTCATIVTTGRYRFAWYGRPIDDADQTVQPVAHAGDAHGYLDEVRISWGDNPLGHGPTGTSIRTRRTQVSDDHQPDPSFAPWLEPATRQGFRCSIALPVFVDDQVDGALMVYASEPGAFDSLAQDLLEDLAADLGYGISRLRDGRERAAASQRLADSERRYRLLAENASDVVWQTESDGRISWVSSSITPTLGWAPDEVVGRPGLELLHPDDHATINTDVRTTLTTQNEFRIRAKDDTYRWMSVTIRTVNVGDSVARIAAMRDINDEMIARQRLEHALGHDQLTGLPTRRVMVDRITAAQATLPRFHVVGVMCIGVDSLSDVNQALTHTAGDLLLTTLAARIATAAHNPDNVGRGSGNELVVLVPDLRSGADISAIAERMRLSVQDPTTIAGQQLSPTISIGIATGGADADPGQLLRDASLALRKAKDNGRDRYEFADPGLAIEAQHRLVLDNDIRQGIAAEEFVPWFQPIVDLASADTVGYEALVRWVRPGRTAQPFSFLHVAEQSSLITDIDIAVLVASVDALPTIPQTQYISVNVSAASLGRPAYVDQAMLALGRTAVDPSRLHIEVTETMLLHPTEAVMATIRQLADLGVRWYIDDFGTGYASITSLRDLPMSGLKLDRSFTYGITSNERTSTQLAQALVGLAEGLGLDTVAEGVETQAQADYLRSLGWRHGQGWLFGRPAPLPVD